MFFFFQAEDGIRDVAVTGVQTCALPIFPGRTYLALHGHRWIKAKARRVVHRLNIHTLAQEEATQLEPNAIGRVERSEEHTSELQSRLHLVCRLLLEKKNTPPTRTKIHLTTVRQS